MGNNTTEIAVLRSSESVVQARIFTHELFDWLAMNATLAMLALLVHSMTARKPYVTQR